MKDITGKVLQINDEIVFTFYGSSTMYRGTIMRFTERRVYIKAEWSAYEYYINKYNVSTRVIKIK